EAGVLDARLVDPDERAGDHVAVVVLADVHRVADARPHHGSVKPAPLTEDLGVPGARGGVVGVGAGGLLLRVLVGTVAPQRALRAVPDLPAMPNVEQAGDLELAEAERRPDAAGPIVVRVHDDAGVVVLHRVPVAPDEQRAFGLAGTERAHVGPARLRHGGVARQAAPEEAAAQV